MAKPECRRPDTLAVAAWKHHLKLLSSYDPRLQELLFHSVARVLQGHVGPHPANLFSVVNENHHAITHVRDWLKSSIVNDVPWLRNVDDEGRPKKLMKCRDLDDLVREADKDMRKQNAAIARKPLVEGDETLEFECAEGWSILRLLTPAALDRESALMQHCIGNGAYDDRLSDDRFRYLSLRDPAGKPHGTMELCDDRLIQFQGKQNAAPLEKYVRIALPFLTERGIDCNWADCGIVTDENRQNYLIHELPERLVVKSQYLTLRSGPERKITLPKFIYTTGSLELLGVFENIPKTIIVEGDLVIGRLRLPQAEYPTSFDQLPGKIHVFGDLCMRQLPVSQLPSDMRVEGRLDAAGTGITSLPAELRCGSFDLCYTAVTQFDTVHFIPDEERRRDRHRVLEARFSKLERIVGEPLFDKLDLTASSLVELPVGLRVFGDLNIERTRVTALPGDMTVGGSLRGDECQITCLPSMLNVGGYAHFDRSVVRLPKKFRMPGTLCVRWGDVEAMAEDIEAENILLIESKLSGLPARIRTGHLHLDRTSVRRIEGDVMVRQLDVCEDFEYLGGEVRISKQISIHCRDRKKGPPYCIAELSESDARAMLKKKGKLDFRSSRKLPKVIDQEWEAEARQSFQRIYDLALRLGEAA
ncbi:PcfJ domain-containing protein [Pararhizobium sp. BT-229]|uniref:PcfJ domain-containing protein n=1 Tax=Pararhizobium sp. BT-229 TaxID=2986923 RepID=UPI0021F7226A|nr:PcfJ domain-containing protein [Pararhizobium sp. BT-229]MCV9964146.1 PcfJ domain-containing protein [Pararhizobium sp. BT-229]